MMDLEKKDTMTPWSAVAARSRASLITLSVVAALGLLILILIETFDLRANHWEYSAQKDPFTDVVSAQAELDSDPSSGHILLECTTGKPIDAIIETEYASFENEQGNLSLRMRFDGEKPFLVAAKGSPRAHLGEPFLRKITKARVFASQFEEPYVTYQPMTFNHLGGTEDTIRRLQKACA